MRPRKTFDWPDWAVKKLIELKKQGKGLREISNTISAEANRQVSIWAVKCKYSALRDFEDLILDKYENDLPKYVTPQLPDGDYLIFCDLHAPYFSTEWVLRALEYSRLFGVKEAISVGDFWDFSFASKHLPLVPKGDTLDVEAEAARPVIKALAKQFNRIYLITGNHERRVANLSESKIWAIHLLNFLIKENIEKFIYIPYDKVYLGDDYLIVHPVSYSQISGSVAIRLCEKYHRNVINAHGHFIASRYDRSGKYIGYDLGGLFDTSRIDYLNLRTTTHPQWNNGFGILKDGQLWHFHEKFLLQRRPAHEFLAAKQRI